MDLQKHPAEGDLCSRCFSATRGVHGGVMSGVHVVVGCHGVVVFSFWGILWSFFVISVMCLGSFEKGSPLSLSNCCKKYESKNAGGDMQFGR